MTTLRYLRPTAGAITIAFAVVNVFLPHTAEANFWSERRRAAERQRGSSIQLASLTPAIPATLAAGLPRVNETPLASLSRPLARALPESFTSANADLLAALPLSSGSVRRVSLPTTKASGTSPITIVHIQDVHMNQDAQKNIAEAVKSLAGAVDLIALEGTDEAIDLSKFRDFPHKDAVRMVADYLLREGKISGPVHTAFTGPADFPPVLGMETPALYQSNVDAYRRAAPHQAAHRTAVAAARSALEKEKQAVYNPALLALDRAVQSHRANTGLLSDYVTALAQIHSPSRPNTPISPAVRDFLSALEMERALDFKRVESERERLIERLIQTLDKADLARLTDRSLAYRAGQIGYADFYRHIEDTCRRAGVSLNDFPAMAGYIRYVLLADGIDMERLFDDIQTLEKTAYAELARSPKELALVRQDRALHLTAKLVDFELNRNEWLEYRETRRIIPDPVSPSAYASDSFTPSLPHSLTPSSIHTLSLADFESFYQAADARDDALAENFLAALKQKGAKKAALVAGGYHAEGLTKRLTDAGVAVVSFTPKIEKLDDAGSAYLSVFTQEKTPLEKLFAGEKLFLAQNPGSRATRTSFAPLLVVGALGMLGLLATQNAQSVFEAVGGGGAVILGVIVLAGSATITLSNRLKITVFAPRNEIVDVSETMDKSLRQVLGTRIAQWTSAARDLVSRLNFQLSMLPFWTRWVTPVKDGLIKLGVPGEKAQRRAPIIVAGIALAVETVFFSGLLVSLFSWALTVFGYWDPAAVSALLPDILAPLASTPAPILAVISSIHFALPHTRKVTWTPEGGLSESEIKTPIGQRLLLYGAKGIFYSLGFLIPSAGLLLPLAWVLLAHGFDNFVLAKFGPRWADELGRSTVKFPGKHAFIKLLSSWPLGMVNIPKNGGLANSQQQLFEKVFLTNLSIIKSAIHIHGANKNLPSVKNTAQSSEHSAQWKSAFQILIDKDSSFAQFVLNNLSIFLLRQMDDIPRIPLLNGERWAQFNYEHVNGVLLIPEELVNRIVYDPKLLALFIFNHAYPLFLLQEESLRSVEEKPDSINPITPMQLDVILKKTSGKSRELFGKFHKHLDLTVKSIYKDYFDKYDFSLPGKEVNEIFRIFCTHIGVRELFGDHFSKLYDEPISNFKLHSLLFVGGGMLKEVYRLSLDTKNGTHTLGVRFIKSKPKTDIPTNEDRARMEVRLFEELHQMGGAVGLQLKSYFPIDRIARLIPEPDKTTFKKRMNTLGFIGFTLGDFRHGHTLEDIIDSISPQQEKEDAVIETLKLAFRVWLLSAGIDIDSIKNGSTEDVSNVLRKKRGIMADDSHMANYLISSRFRMAFFIDLDEGIRTSLKYLIDRLNELIVNEIPFLRGNDELIGKIINESLIPLVGRNGAKDILRYYLKTYGDPKSGKNIRPKWIRMPYLKPFVIALAFLDKSVSDELVTGKTNSITYLATRNPIFGIAGAMVEAGLLFFTGWAPMAVAVTSGLTGWWIPAAGMAGIAAAAFFLARAHPIVRAEIAARATPVQAVLLGLNLSPHPVFIDSSARNSLWSHFGVFSPYLVLAPVLSGDLTAWAVLIPLIWHLGYDALMIYQERKLIKKTGRRALVPPLAITLFAVFLAACSPVPQDNENSAIEENSSPSGSLISTLTKVDPEDTDDQTGELQVEKDATEEQYHGLKLERQSSRSKTNRDPPPSATTSFGGLILESSKDGKAHPPNFLGTIKSNNGDGTKLKSTIKKTNSLFYLATRNPIWGMAGAMVEAGLLFFTGWAPMAVAGTAGLTGWWIPAAGMAGIAAAAFFLARAHPIVRAEIAAGATPAQAVLRGFNLFPHSVFNDSSMKNSLWNHFGVFSPYLVLAPVLSGDLTVWAALIPLLWHLGYDAVKIFQDRAQVKKAGEWAANVSMGELAGEPPALSRDLLRFVLPYEGPVGLGKMDQRGIVRRSSAGRVFDKAFSKAMEKQGGKKEDVDPLIVFRVLLGLMSGKAVDSRDPAGEVTFLTPTNEMELGIVEDMIRARALSFQGAESETILPLLVVVNDNKRFAQLSELATKLNARGVEIVPASSDSGPAEFDMAAFDSAFAAWLNQYSIRRLTASASADARLDTSRIADQRRKILDDALASAFTLADIEAALRIAAYLLKQA